MKFSLQLSRHSVTFHCCMNQPEKLSKHVVPHNSKYCSIDAFCTKSPKTVVVARLVTFPRPCGHSTFHPAVYSLTNEQLVARRPADKYLMPVRSIRTFIELYSPVLYGSAWPRNCRYHLSNIAASSGLEQVVRPITNSSVLQSATIKRACSWPSGVGRTQLQELLIDEIFVNHSSRTYTIKSRCCQPQIYEFVHMYASEYM